MFTYVYFIFRNEIINKSGSVYAKTKRQKKTKNNLIMKERKTQKRKNSYPYFR
jgi:hypothetical protein